jgi:membrane-associated phospholipid phosphatase
MRTPLILIMLLTAIPVVAQSGQVPDERVAAKKPAMKFLVPGITALATAAFIVDEPVISFLRSNQTGYFNMAARYTDMGGEKKIVIPAALLTYGTARFILKEERLQFATLNAFQSVIVTALATESIKYMAGRARPFTDQGPYSFKPFPGNIDRLKSLPSGHASLAFALFTPFAETYTRWIYLIPASVAIGRVYQDKHWLSDVIAGGGIGLISGILFTHNKKVQIIPGGMRIYLN